MAMANATLISCNSSTSTHLPLNNHKISRTSLHFTQLKVASLLPHRFVLSSSKSAIHLKRCRFLQICHSSSLKNQQEESKEESVVGGSKNGNGNGNGNGDGNGGRDWTSSILLFFLWAGLIYYVFFLTPNQTPGTEKTFAKGSTFFMGLQLGWAELAGFLLKSFDSSRDMYFLQKLLNLKGDDGFRMNEVLVSLWYIMGLWPLAYSMLLLPTGRSSKSKVPVWPFLLLSCFGGAYALLPYFILWNPPAPPVEETELKSWPLIFLESKVTAVISLAAGACIIIYACLAGADTWTEFFQYFRESKFIHITSIDFTLLSTFAPFWVYNDMTTRKWFDKGSWLLPISLIPFLGPGLYLLLRPSLSTMAIPQTPAEPE